MRISDWISDVSSSDLPPPSGRAPYWDESLSDDESDAEVSHKSAYAKVCSFSSLLGHSTSAVYWPRSIASALGGTLPKQIGIAPCRVRVWQYVSITVVAGTLQKIRKATHGRR